jgi:hypothetical protein
MTFIFFFAQFAAPNNGMASAPHVPPRSCALLNIPPTANTNFWFFLCCPTKRWPPKAEVISLSLIFDVLHFGAPNKGTNSNESAPNTVCLVWAHRDQRCQDVGPWQMLQWHKMAKLLEGKAMAAHVGCCVFCVFVFCVVFMRPFSYRGGRKLMSA